MLKKGSAWTNLMKQLVKFSLGFILLPLCFGLTKALVGQLSSVGEFSGRQFYFLIGFAGYFVLQLVFFKPIRTYIFGHELTHAFWSLIFGGKVKRLKVSKSGGSVLLTKSNILVTLAPYFFPIYTFLTLAIYSLFRILLKTYPEHFTFFGKPQLEIVMLFLVGFTLAFHLALTFDSLCQRQSDIHKTGIFFSLVFILIANLIVIILVLKLVWPTQISLGIFLKESVQSTVALWENIITKCKTLIAK
ncbi:MAG TPA: hypothetical protein DHV62_07440 [Elusimicrobia bacterium]|jgi:hypothetical protein|nr:hypothetical protein [Elusimicrobiota bacterium]